MKLSIIVPAYNPVELKRNIEELASGLGEVTKDYEIIIINDGSTNGEFKQLGKLPKQVNIVGYSRNKGKGSAIKYGFRFVKGDYVAFVDSGRDLDPKQLKDFMKIMEKSGADIVVGSKRHKKSKVHYPFSRRVMSWTYQIMNKILFNLNVRDTQVGIKLFKKSVLNKVMPKIVIKRFAFDLELLVIANKYDYQIVEAPVDLRYSFGSTINIKAVFWMLWDTAAIWYRLMVRRQYDE